MEKHILSFACGSVTSRSILISSANFLGSRPAVLIFPDWSGCNAFAEEKAHLLAMQGYVVLAVDLYGDGRLGHTNEEKAALMQPLKADPHQLRIRVGAAFHALSTQKNVVMTHVSAIGFCFGGHCALELARSGVNVAKVVSFHGLLQPGLPAENIFAKILVLHGYDDPMVQPAELAAFQQEMTQLGVDWQTHVYGGVMHAFTNPLANDVAFGTVYHAKAAYRSWQTMENFLMESDE